MKTSVLSLIILVLTTIFSLDTFSQGSGAIRAINILNEQRELELERAERRMIMSDPDQQEQIRSEIREINNRYDLLVKQVISTDNKSEQENQEKIIQQEEKNSRPKRTRERRVVQGSSVTHEGRRGVFTGNNFSVIRGAEAYAKIVKAEANAYLIEQYARNLNLSEAISPTGGGIRVLLSNEYRHVDVNIRIVNQFTKQESVVFLRRGERSIINLSPGDYSYVAWANNGMNPSSVKNFSINLNNFYKFDGERFGFYIVVGSR